MQQSAYLVVIVAFELIAEATAAVVAAVAAAVHAAATSRISLLLQPRTSSQHWQRDSRYSWHWKRIGKPLASGSARRRRSLARCSASQAWVRLGDWDPSP